jgi:hypothetical protein
MSPNLGSPYTVTFVLERFRKLEEHMAKLMSKSELIQKIADEHSNGLLEMGQGHQVRGHQGALIPVMANVSYSPFRESRLREFRSGHGETNLVRANLVRRHAPWDIAFRGGPKPHRTDIR